MFGNVGGAAVGMDWRKKLLIQQIQTMRQPPEPSIFLSLELEQELFLVENTFLRPPASKASLVVKQSVCSANPFFVLWAYDRHWARC